MVTFDNMESTNARGIVPSVFSNPCPEDSHSPFTLAWDEGTEVNHLPGPVTEPKWRCTEQSTRATSGEMITNNSIQLNVRKPRMVTGQYHLKRQHGRAVQAQTGKAAEWVKQNAVNTKRKQDHLDREAEKAARSVEFFGIPTYGNFLATGYYFWSDRSIDLSNLLGDDLQLLDDIRTAFEVYIDFLQDLNCIRLRSKSKYNIQRGIISIKAKIRHIRADAVGLAPIYIVEPPSTYAVRSGVSPNFEDSQQLEKNLVIKKVVISGSTLTAEQLATWEIERQSIIKYNRDRFFGYMVKALAELRALNSVMRMRVHLGNIQLLYYRKELKDGDYSLQKFSSMMEESRTKARVEKIIGDACFTKNILSHLKCASSIFDPTDSLTSHLEDIKPKHTLVVLARGPLRQHIRIEADIDMVQGAIQEKFEKARDAAWQIGAINYYQHNTRKTRLSASILCLESNFDWCLQIITDDMIVKPPKAFQNVVVGSLSGTTTDCTESTSFNYPSVKLQVSHGIVVDEVWIRSMLHYKLKNTPYIVEVAIYREWKNGDTKQKPLINCGVSFYHKDWDLLMIPDEGIQGLRDWNTESLFPKEPGADDGFSQFLAHVQVLKSFFDDACMK